MFEPAINPDGSAPLFQLSLLRFVQNLKKNQLKDLKKGCLAQLFIATGGFLRISQQI